MEAVIDSIMREARKARLIVGVSEQEITVSTDLLPASALEGDWVTVIMKNEVVVEISLDPLKTTSNKERIRKKLELLKQNATSQFKVLDK